MTGSNRRPPACKAGALPAELIPLKSRPTWLTQEGLVGLVGLEPTTPALSRRCSNQLSYRPVAYAAIDPDQHRYTKYPGCRHHTLSTALTLPFALRAVSKQPMSVSAKSQASFQKGGDPAAPSDTATLLRLHPSHEPCRGNRPPYG